LLITVAAEIGAPDGSVTIPVMLAATCARTGEAPAKARKRATVKHNQADLLERTRPKETIGDLSSALERIVEPPEKENTIQYSSYRYVKPT
jgi:hypothetical protein